MGFRIEKDRFSYSHQGNYKNHDFAFDLSMLVNYIKELSLDAIAITNHNTFDRLQYETICATVVIPVFPGIEVDVENGHLLILASQEDMLDFATRCEKVNSLITTPNDYLNASQFEDIFPSLDKYLLIPHYEKSPILQLAKIPYLARHIICGEVNSPKKFIACKKALDKLTPVYFSDIRIKNDLRSFPARCTYVDVDRLVISSIKQALSDKNKVALSAEEGHRLIDILSNGLKISTGLTVLLGERSSGKTHTLDEIAKNVENSKYIRQFSLLTKDSDADKKKFEDSLKNRCASISEEFLSAFKNVVEDVKDISLDKDEAMLEDYIISLIKFASEADKEDIFSKTRLFNEPPFEQRDLSALHRLIDAVSTLLDNEEFSELISRFVTRETLIKLLIALMERYNKENELLLKKNYINEIIEGIKTELRVRTATSPVHDIDFYNILMNKKKIERFNKIANGIKKRTEIFSKDMYSYKVVAIACPFNGAQELKNISGKVIAFSDAFEKYHDPYSYLCVLKSKEELPVSDYYKFFVNIKYEVLNKYGFKASGGERAEYNLIEQLVDATQYDILLLDEPESSFDNLFLKNNVNRLIKDISQIVPVVLATHNNTIGASINPDYILYTRKQVSETGKIAYQIFSGFPTSTVLTEVSGQNLNKRDVLLNCLEAGESTYMERRIIYEMLND